MKSIVCLLRKVYRLRYKIRWFFQFRKTIREGYYHKVQEKLPIENLYRTLVIAPHSDDEWIGASSIIQNSKVVDVLYMEFYGDNYSKSNIITRRREICNSSILNKFNLVSINSANRKGDLIRVLQKQYTSIFIPSYVDWHSEHRETFKIFTEVYMLLRPQLKSTIYLYNISVPQLNNPKYIKMMPMTKKEQFYKWDMFSRIYLSQDMPIFRYKLQERINAYYVKRYASELFVEMSEEMLKEGLNVVEDAIKNFELDTYKNKINNIFSIRKAIFLTKK